jgi:outer membrane protein
MKSRFATLLAAGTLAAAPLFAQETRTPPIQPTIRETPLPPPVELPAPPSIPADVPNRPLTAQEAAEIALRHQSAIASAAAGVESAEGRERQVRAGLKPSVGLNAGYSHLETLSGSQSGTGGSSATGFSGYTGGVTARQLVFDFAHTRDLVRQASALQEAASANLTRVQADLVLQTKQTFYDFLRNVRLTDVNAANLRAQQAHVALARARLDAGVGLPSDVVRAETAVSEAALALNLSRNAAALSRVALNNLMGIDPRTPVQPAESGELVAPELNVDALVEVAVRRRPEMVQADANARAAEHGESAARSTNAPSVSASVGLNTRGNNFPPGNSNLSIGATIQWDVFDAGFTAGRVQEARANVAAARAAQTGARQDIIADVSEAWLNLVSARQRVDTARAQVSNAEESVRLAEGRYRGGLGTFLEVTDAQAALLAAQTGEVNAQTAVDQAYAALTRAVGGPLP